MQPGKSAGAQFSILQVSEQTQVGYGPDFLLFPEKTSDHWQLSFARPTRALRPLKDEAVRAARQLSAQYGGAELSLLYSGGIDSEFMICCFREAQVPFKVLTYRFEDHLNEHDLSYATDFFRQNKDVKSEMIDFKLQSFFSSGEYLDYAQKSRCVLPHLLPLMKMVSERQREVCILATGEPFLVPHLGHWCLRERESVGGLDRFFRAEKLPGTPTFFQATPELFFSYLTDAIFQQLARGERVGKEHSLTSRIDIYSRDYPIKSRTKYHGYEKIEETIAGAEKELLRRFGEYNNMKYFKYAEFLKLVAEEDR